MTFSFSPDDSPFSTEARLFNGTLTFDLIWYIFAGMAGILVGSQLAAKVVEKINAQMMKKCIYLFLAMVETITFIQNV